MKSGRWFALSVFLFSCAAPWTVIREASPTSLLRTSRFAIDGTTFFGLSVGNKSEADYLADKSDEQKEGFAADKLAFIAGFAKMLQERRGPLDIVGANQLASRVNIRSNVTFLEPGRFEGLYNAPTEMRTRVSIADPKHTVLDEIEIRCVVSAELFRPSVGARIGDCGRVTGERVARYLRRRVGLE